MSARSAPFAALAGRVFVFAVLATALAGADGPARPVTVHDIAALRTLSGGLGEMLALSPDGETLAYVLREADFAADVNDYVIHLVSVRTRPATLGRGRALLRTRGRDHDGLRGLLFRWAGNDRIWVVHRPASATNDVVSLVDVRSGECRQIFAAPGEVQDFTGDQRGQRCAVVYQVPLPTGPQDRLAARAGVVMGPDDDWIDFRREQQERGRKPQLVIVQRDGRVETIGAWNARNLSLSPDGRWLVAHLSVREAALEQGLPLGEFPDGSNVALIIATSAVTQVRLAYPGPVRASFGDASEWSADSRWYTVIAPADRSPVSAATLVERLAHESAIHLVDRETFGSDRVAGVEDAPAAEMRQRKVLAIAEGPKVVVQLPDGEITTRGRDATGVWREVERMRFRESRLRNPGGIKSLAWSPRFVVGFRQDPMTPPDLWRVDLTTREEFRLTQLNPELEHQALGRVEKIAWADGPNRYWGHIVYPVDYRAGETYPGAILAKSWDDSFIHGGQVYQGGFPPQALAGSGILVLMLGDAEPGSEEGNFENPGESPHRKWYGARRELVSRGLIDPARVGIMGFSHTGFHVSRLLAESGPDPQWAAAVLHEGGLNHFAALWSRSGNTILTGFSDGVTRMGGNTFDQAYERWRQRSLGWRAAGVRTPVFQTIHGRLLRFGAELHNSLWVRGKPVETVWYPDGEHILQKPSEREASMQHILDWFRFWLQDYERPSVPEDPERYQRWQSLRDQHQRNERWLAEGKDPNEEYYRTIRKVVPEATRTNPLRAN